MTLRLVSLFISLVTPLSAIGAAPLSTIVTRIALHDGGWDTLTVDPESRRVLIARSDGVDAVDTQTGAVTARLITGTRFHHNVLVHTGDPYGTGIGAGVWLYNNCRDVAIYNNTFDAGAPLARDFDAPIISLSSGCNLSTLRNNVFTGVRAINGLANNAIVARGGKEKDLESRVAYADYNCFFNPDAPRAADYDPQTNAQKEAGIHDVKGDPKFAKGRLIPYPVNDEDIWMGKMRVSQVLALYRERYAPGAGSPLIGAGDPQDGKGSFIGAIGPGGNTPPDRFGRFSDKMGGD